MSNPLSLKDLEQLAQRRNEEVRMKRVPEIGTKVWLK